ncbi:peptidoglycan-binding domain-containing protein [Enhydrobacter aerosaccus]|nr:peptidoglycan-binding domain-containing protein [Enhydrobacter aerosaccus]
MAVAQSAGEVERCFQNPAGCTSNGGASPQAAPRPAPTPAPDYASVLKSPESERRKLQESLRTLDKYNGPIDGNLQSEASEKAITDWQKGHGYTPVGKLTPTEAVTLNNEAAKVPIKRINPSAAGATPATPPSPPAATSNAEALKALQARLAERRKAAEPKAEAAVQALVRDLKAYVAADGKGVAGDQFQAFAKWYADDKTAGRTIGDIAPSVEDYGEAGSGDAVTAQVTFQTKQGDVNYPQCLMFAWVEGNPRKNAQAFSCDDVAAVEKWKTEQSLKSAWR